MRVLPEALLGVERPFARPVHLHLEHTTRCDHHCSTCIRATRVDGEEDMPFDDACAHLDAVAPRFLSLNGIGEPLLHPRWDDIARYAIERHHASVTFASTGVHFRAQKERIVASGMHLVKVSFHGALPKTFSRLASGRELDVVEDGIRALLDEKGRARRGPDVRINYVVSSESVDEMAEAVAVAARCGVEAVYFKGALVPAGRTSGLAAEHDAVALTAAIDAAEAAASSKGIRTNLAHWRREVARVGHLPPGQRPPPAGRCLIPWVSVFIRVDGTVLPCCNCTFRPDEGRMGRIGEDGDFEHIWRARPLVALRSELNAGTYSLKICQDCPDPVTVAQTAEAAANELWPGFLSI